MTVTASSTSDPFAAHRLAPAVADLGWLLGRGYAPKASLKLVGDRHALDGRQREAVRRMSCSPAQAADRAARRVPRAEAVWIDGFNVLTTVREALAGRPLLRCADGTVRDMAGMHGRRADDADAAAIAATRATLAALGVTHAHWLLDAPVSGSGRLAAALGAIPGWTAAVVADPDPVLIAHPGVIATADAGILDGCGAWLDLARLVVDGDGAQRTPPGRYQS